MKRSTWLLLAACLPPLAYLLAALSASVDAGQGVRPAASLDDAYIYFQYAKNFAAGHPFSYQSGDAPSTGVTGLSYLFILAGLLKLGMQAAWAAWFVGSASWMLSAYFLSRLRQRRFPAVGQFSMLALWLGLGPLCAAYFNGLETGLFLALLLGAVEAADDPESGPRFWVFLALLAWTRPEGQVAAFCFASWRLGTRLPRPWAAAGLALAIACGPSLLLYALTGSVVPDSVRAKTSSFGDTSFHDHLRDGSEFLMAAFKGIGMGFFSAQDSVGFVGDATAGNPATPHFPPGMLLLAAFGYMAPALRRPGSAFTPLIAWALLGLAMQAWGMPVGWHQHRYLIHFAPALFIGALSAFQSLPDGAARRALYLMCFGFGLLSAPWALIRNYDNAKNYRDYHGAAALWLKGHLAPGTPVAVVDAGILAYESGMRIVDLPGITDHALSLAAKRAAEEGSRPLFKELLSRPAALRPRYAALHEGRPDFDVRGWRDAGILKEIARIQPDPSKSLVIYEWNWDPITKPPR